MLLLTFHLILTSKQTLSMTLFIFITLFDLEIIKHTKIMALYTLQPVTVFIDIPVAQRKM